MPPVEPPVEKPTSTDTAPTQGPAQAQPKPPLKERLKALMTEYGFLAVLIYLSTSVVSMTVFTILIQSADLKALGERVPRIFATLALTPLIARIPFVARQLKRLED